nr:hypothetical protein [Clostridium thermarum]
MSVRILASELQSERHIALISMKRNSCKNKIPKAFRQRFFKARRRIETSISQLAEQLNAQKVLAKSMWGLVSRISYSENKT